MSRIFRRAQRSGIDEAHELAEALEQQITAAGNIRLAELTRTLGALGPDWQTRINDQTAFLMESAKLRHALRGVRAGTSTLPPGLRLQASTRFLTHCHGWLTSHPNGFERLTFITGTESDGTRILSEIVHVENSNASPAFVQADPQATHAMMIELSERFAMPVLAMWHAHPGTGANATRPSATDLAMQARFVAGGWDRVIGGIFVKDGWVRLFAPNLDFAFALYGAGARIVQDNPREKLLKLELPS